MNKKTVIYALVLVLAGLLLVACGGSEGDSEPDRVATRVAEELAVVATLTASAPQPTEVAQVTATATEVPPTVTEVLPTATEVLPTATQVPATVTQVPPTATQVPPTATQVPPTATQVPPTATPPPSPTPINIAVLPVDGSDGNQNLGNDHPVKNGRNVTLPGFAQHEVSDPMVFRERMVFQVEVRDFSAGSHDGAGIDNVRFTITDSKGQVHFRQENNAGYCVFGGGEPDCNVWWFADSGYRWPDGAQLSPGGHSVVIDITPKQGEPVSWFWTFNVELP